MFSLVEEEPGAMVHVDLESATLTLPDGREVSFPIDAFFRECLLKGLDQMGYILDKMRDIEAYEASHAAPVLSQRPKSPFTRKPTSGSNAMM